MSHSGVVLSWSANRCNTIAFMSTRVVCGPAYDASTLQNGEQVWIPIATHRLSLHIQQVQINAMEDTLDRFRLFSLATAWFIICILCVCILTPTVAIQLSQLAHHFFRRCMNRLYPAHPCVSMVVILLCMPVYHQEKGA